MEFVDFSLIGPVSTQFTNYFEISLKNSYVRRKHRIKILKTISTRYCNYLVHMVFRFPIYNTGPVKKFFGKKTSICLLQMISTVPLIKQQVIIRSFIIYFLQWVPLSFFFPSISLFQVMFFYFISIVFYTLIILRT